MFVEELLVAQLVNKFSTYYEIRKASYSVCIDIDIYLKNIAGHFSSDGL